VDLFDKLSAYIPAERADLRADYGVFAGVFLEQTMTDLPKQCPSGNVVPVRLDVTSESSVELAAAFIVDHLASIPGAQLVAVCNNAYVVGHECVRASELTRLGARARHQTKTEAAFSCSLAPRNGSRPRTSRTCSTSTCSAPCW